MKVLQICFGEIPKHLQGCVESVKEWSNVNGFEYEQLTHFNIYGFETLKFQNLKYKFFYLRHVSDFMRTKYLAENINILYVDWDIFLYEDFKIKNLKRSCFANDHCIDSIMYNGEELEVWKNIHRQIETPNTSDVYNLSMSIQNYIRRHAVNRFEGRYIHFDNCRFSDIYLKD